MRMFLAMTAFALFLSIHVQSAYAQSGWIYESGRSSGSPTAPNSQGGEDLLIGGTTTYDVNGHARFHAVDIVYVLTENPNAIGNTAHSHDSLIGPNTQGSGLTHRTAQINQITSFLDGSVVYSLSPGRLPAVTPVPTPRPTGRPNTRAFDQGFLGGVTVSAR